jgi:phage-related protein
MDLIIERLNGETYSFIENNIFIIDFTVHAPTPNHKIEQFDGRDGHVDMGTTYEGRTLSGSFLMQADSEEGFSVLRNRVFRILDSKEPFYLISTDQPDRRWKVKTSGGYSPEQIKKFGRFSITFISNNAYAESIGTTLNPAEGLVVQASTNYGDPPIQYSFSSDSDFQVWNDSDTVIDPRQHDLEIQFVGASSNLKISNTTTGDTWQYNGTSNVSDVILLKGVRSTKNNLSIVGNTNKNLITLIPGYNNFVISGATNPFEIAFDFRFLYV